MIRSLSITGSAKPVRCSRAPQGLHVGEGRDVRPRASFLPRFRLQERRAQLEQGLAAQHRREQQAVRLERLPDLDQRARQVVHPMKAERAHHEIERIRADRQPFLVGDKARRTRSARDHGRREVSLDQQIGRGLPAQHGPELPAMAAEIEDAGEAALHVVEPAHQPLAHLAHQEVAPPREAGGGAVAVGTHGHTVEDRGAVGLSPHISPGSRPASRGTRAERTMRGHRGSAATPAVGRGRCHGGSPGWQWRSLQEHAVPRKETWPRRELRVQPASSSATQPSRKFMKSLPSRLGDATQWPHAESKGRRSAFAMCRASMALSSGGK